MSPPCFFGYCFGYSTRVEKTLFGSKPLRAMVSIEGLLLSLKYSNDMDLSHSTLTVIVGLQSPLGTI
jgi:hypothetical protein